MLASIGIYGVLSYSVSRRTREVGIRMALGASAAGMQRSVVARTLALAAVGIGIGLAIAGLAGWLPSRRASRIDPLVVLTS